MSVIFQLFLEVALILVPVLFVVLWFFTEIASWFYTRVVTKAAYIPNSKRYIKEAFQLADLGSADVLYDLGSGDGRALKIALKGFGVRKAVGFEIDYFQVLKTKVLLLLAVLSSQKWEVYRKSLFEAQPSDCTVLYLYLYPKVLERVKAEILPKLKAGTRMVVCRFPFEGLEPDQILSNRDYSTFLYIVR